MTVNWLNRCSTHKTDLSACNLTLSAEEIKNMRKEIFNKSCEAEN